MGADIAKAHSLLATAEFFWIDLVGADDAARAAWVAELGFGPGDAAWLQRFGQAGRISLDQSRLRAATWLSEGPGKGLTEIHVLGSRRCVLTAWDGDPAALDGACLPYRAAYSSASMLGLLAVVDAGLAVAALAQCSIPDRLSVLTGQYGLPEIEPLDIVVARSAQSNRPTCDFLAAQMQQDLSRPEASVPSEESLEAPGSLVHG